MNFRKVWLRTCLNTRNKLKSMISEKSRTDYPETNPYYIIRVLFFFLLSLLLIKHHLKAGKGTLVQQLQIIMLQGTWKNISLLYMTIYISFLYICKQHASCNPSKVYSKPLWFASWCQWVSKSVWPRSEKKLNEILYYLKQDGWPHYRYLSIYKVNTLRLK